MAYHDMYFLCFVLACWHFLTSKVKHSKGCTFKCICAFLLRLFKTRNISLCIRNTFVNIPIFMSTNIFRDSCIYSLIITKYICEYFCAHSSIWRPIWLHKLAESSCQSHDFSPAEQITSQTSAKRRRLQSGPGEASPEDPTRSVWCKQPRMSAASQHLNHIVTQLECAGGQSQQRNVLMSKHVQSALCACSPVYSTSHVVFFFFDPSAFKVYAVTFLLNPYNDLHVCSGAPVHRTGSEGQHFGQQDTLFPRTERRGAAVAASNPL